MLKLTKPELVFAVLLSTGLLGAAEIAYRVTNDAGEVIASGKVETNDAALAQVEVWRVTQQERDDTGTGVPDSMSEVIKRVLVTFIHGVLNQSPTPELEQRIEEYKDARKAVDSLVWEAAH